MIGVIELIGCFPGAMKFAGLGGTPYALFNPKFDCYKIVTKLLQNCYKIDTKF